MTKEALLKEFVEGNYTVFNQPEVNGKEEQGIYRPELKAEFLKQYNVKSQLMYIRIFQKSYKIEKEDKTELANFSIDQFKKLFYSLEPLTVTASHVSGRITDKYVSWSIANGYTNRNGNPLSTKDVNWFNQFVNTEKSIYFSAETIAGAVTACENMQDAVIIQMLFEGIQGKALSELRNMTKADIKPDNMEDLKVILKDDDGKTREFDVSVKLKNMLVKAANEKTYYKKNNSPAPSTIGDSTILLDTDYVLRSSKTRTPESHDPIEKMTLYRRVQLAADAIGLKSQHFTTKNIVRSGMIYEGFKRYQEKGYLENDDYIKIAKKYKIQNWYPLKKFVNEHNIKEIYKKHFLLQA